MLDNRIEKIISAPILTTKNVLEVLALLDVRHCPKLQSCAISRKSNDATLRKWQKPKFWTRFGAPNFFSWVLPLLVVRQCSKLSTYAISRKTNEPNLKK